jgi:hypothetical protein
MIPSLEIVRELSSFPSAPASESPAAGADPTSPGNAPSPGCSGVAVASALKNEETELADISGVIEIKVVGRELGAEVIELVS